ncbi:MAG TPA: MFS transporter [Thermomicrobiales bacterium]|nr:MFS transporter [Thermomicrobiales bacterium]
MLATTVSTPLWGKFADLFDRKLLLQLSLIVFVFGSALAGQSHNAGMLIGFRVVQGLGAGGLTALGQVVLADIISPRERGRYMGLLGAVMSVGTVGGPLLGGLITDSIGWRWNFYVGVPIAVIAILLIQKTLKLPKLPRRVVDIDYLGAALIASGVSLLLIWVSLAGSQFAWASTSSYLMVLGSIVLLALAVFAEMRAAEPIIPLTLFRNRTVVMAVIASVAVGVAMFGTSVFLSQYMQLARGKSPTESGLLTIPMVFGTLISSIGGGQLISRTGIWKPFMVAGSIIMTIGIAAMGTIRSDTSFVLVSLYMVALGLGVGLVMQNLVLVVQNVVSVRQLGAASSTISFFRSLGGSIGVSVMGAVLASRVSGYISDGLANLGVGQGGAASSGQIPKLSELPEPVRLVVEHAYGHGVGDVFMIAVPMGIITCIAVALLPNRSLGTRSAAEQMDEELRVATSVLRSPAPDDAKVPQAPHGEAKAPHSMVRS